ncbi:MAG: SDR family NAD(P)-dependent oxidoreductase, partial [Candidatus Competibacteraceae bacterium]|nr:SDR family NAD(P)-dependent oxidoreductase [Candidatus Competibacteraceae bacterium]
MTQTTLYPSLKDRVVFVTGGGGGIGASIVEHFCAQGSKVGFVDINRETSEQLITDLTAKGLPKPHFVHCDLKNIAALHAA